MKARDLMSGKSTLMLMTDPERIAEIRKLRAQLAEAREILEIYMAGERPTWTYYKAEKWLRKQEDGE